MTAMVDEIAEILTALRDELRNCELIVPDGVGAKFQAGLPLILSAFDLAVSMSTLVRFDPEGGWVAAHTLHRPQFEHFVRGMFFLGPASEAEAHTFLSRGVLPFKTITQKKGRTRHKKKVPISRDDMAEKVAKYFQFGDTLATAYSATYGSNSGLLHGGREIHQIYWQGGELGTAKATPDEIVGTFCNPLVVALSAFAHLASLGLKSLYNARTHELLGRGAEILQIAGTKLDASTSGALKG
jgi:hypothetical protein